MSKNISNVHYVISNVHFESDINEIGDFVNVKINKANAFDLIGENVE